jgi:hypothetical protein
VRVGQNHDGISGSRVQTGHAVDTVIDTVNFSGFKRSVTAAAEFKLMNSSGISESWLTLAKDREQLRT